MSDLFGQEPARPARAIGGHQSARATTTTWLTPPHVIEGLGGADSFDLDPCGFAGSPIRTALRSYCLPVDGLAQPWDGRVWLNPPYTSGEIDGWLARLAEHGRGVALIFARTETAAFHRHVWSRASGLLFLEGRLHFHLPDGRRAGANAGAPSVLCAYGSDDLDRLAASDLPGALVPLRLSRGVLVLALADERDDSASWRAVVRAYLQRNGGAATVSDLYRALARHPKAAGRAHWRAKVRQTLQRGPFERRGRGAWRLCAEEA